MGADEQKTTRRELQEGKSKPQKSMTKM